MRRGLRLDGPDRGSGRVNKLPRVGGRLVTVGLLVVMVLALLVSMPGRRGVLHTVRRINPIWIVVALALELASDDSFVVLFRLFFDRLPKSDARLLGWTEQASGALLCVVYVIAVTFRARSRLRVRLPTRPHTRSLRFGTGASSYGLPGGSGRHSEQDRELRPVRAHAANESSAALGGIAASAPGVSCGTPSCR
jgi:hypothetical protein